MSRIDIEARFCPNNRTRYRWVDGICWIAAAGLVVGMFLMGRA